MPFERYILEKPIMISPSRKEDVLSALKARDFFVPSSCEVLPSGLTKFYFSSKSPDGKSNVTYKDAFTVSDEKDTAIFERFKISREDELNEQKIECLVLPDQNQVIWTALLESSQGNREIMDAWRIFAVTVYVRPQLAGTAIRNEGSAVSE